MIEKELNINDKSLASLYEMKQLLIMLNRLEEDEPLAYSITTKMIDFMSDYYYNKDKADPVVIDYLINLYETQHMHIREKINKALMKLMNKNYKIIRRSLILTYNRENMPDLFKKEIDAMLNTVFSGIYFDYSNINEAKEELKNMMADKDTEETSE